MTQTTTLTLIKTMHTLVWVFFNIVIFYMLYAAVSNQLDWRLWLGFGLVAAEGVVLLVFGWACPLTVLARRYTAVRPDNFDIYLPNWLARHTKRLYTSLVLVIALITAYQLLK